MSLAQNPWWKLKQVEKEAMLQRRKGSLLPATLSRLRKLYTKCSLEPDAEEAIAYHGCLSLLCEADRDWSNALKHRQLEISKIRRLYKLEELNPTDGYATQGYQEADLSERRAILAQIKRKAAEASGRTDKQDRVAAPPSFESRLLHDMASVIARRGKAIRYLGRLEFSRAIEDSGERLNVDFAAVLHHRLRLSVWEDCVFWLGISVPGPRRTGGWKYRVEVEGNLSGLDSHEVLDHFEQTIHSPREARSIWKASK